MEYNINRTSEQNDKSKTQTDKKLKHKWKKQKNNLSRANTQKNVTLTIQTIRVI